MAPSPKIESHGQATLKKYENRGFWIGLALGLFVGVIVSGPNFRHWSTVTLFLVMFTCTVGGAVIGYFAGTIGASSTSGRGIDLGGPQDLGGHFGGGGDASGGSDGGGSGSD